MIITYMIYMLRFNYMISFIFSFLAILISAKIVGVFYSSWIALLIFTFILTIINFTIKPVLKFLTWPINFITLGLFHFILNILILLFVSMITPGFVFASFLQAAIFSIVLGILKWILSKFSI